VVFRGYGEAAPTEMRPARPAEVRIRALISTADRIEISYQIPSPNLTQTRRDNHFFDQVDLPGVVCSTSEPGALPVVRQFIAISPCDSVELEVEVYDVETKRDVHIPSNGSSAEGNDALSRRQAVPMQWARLVDIQYARGQALARVEIYPLKYDRDTRTLLCPREIRLRLKPLNPNGPISVNAGPLQSALSAAVPNLEGVAPSAGQIAAKTRIVQSAGQVCWCDSPDDNWEDAADYVTNNCAADYLIIVADELLTDAADSFLVEQLATKRVDFNGFNVAIARMGQIDSTPDNSNTPVLIRNFVEAIYDGQTAGHMEDGSLGFLLLIGDAINPAGQVILPTSYWNLNNYATEDLNGADAYYVLLDGTNDVVPDLLIGRLPVDADENDWELSNVVSKITLFEPIAASAAWTDKILMMSGGDDQFFTFQGEGLSGFEGYFDSIEGSVPNSGKTFKQLHRLAASNDNDFSKEVCDSIAGGYSIVGLFDHANPVNFAGAFHPLYYDTLQNDTSLSLVLSFGSHSGFFDRLQTTWCCPDPSFAGLPCKSPPTPIDDCDALTERLIVQPAGAIGVVAYGRSNQAPIVQQAFANAFRALLQHKQGQLGGLVLATKLLTGDPITTRSLNLLGDPALNIDYQFDSVAQDSIDLSVSGLDMAFTTTRNDFGSSSVTQTLQVTVSNLWREDANSVPVEVWRGPPDEAGSSLLNSFTLSSVPANGNASWTGSIGSFSDGDHDIHVTVDPDNTLDDPVRANNVSYRVLHTRDYVAGFPRAAAYSLVDIVDAVLSTPKRLEIAAGGSLYDHAGASLGSGGPMPL
jgi:hypothetical protein